ncbi:hypothetical protein ACQZV8_14455 [Magnetococcales bacterium HHB-1]
MKYPRTSKLFSLLLLLLLMGWKPATAEMVEVIASGPSKQAAVNTALRMAIEQVAGTLIQASSQVNNGRLDLDRLVTSSSGVVKKYRILAERKDPIESVYKVKVQADVNTEKLQVALKEFFKDPRFQKAFQNATFDQRRVMVLYRFTPGRAASSGGLSANSPGPRVLVDLVEDRLTEYGFRVFLPRQVQRIQKKVAAGIVNQKSALALAQQEQADAMVWIDLTAHSDPSSYNYWKIQFSMSAKAFDATTGELFATVHEQGKAMSQGSAGSVENGLVRGIRQSTPAMANKLVEKIVGRFSGAREKFVVVSLRNLKLQYQDQVEDLMDDQGWKYRVNRQTGDYLELEVFSEYDPTTFRRVFRRAVRKAKIPLMSVEMKGNRVIFQGR